MKLLEKSLTVSLGIPLETRSSGRMLDGTRQVVLEDLLEWVLEKLCIGVTPKETTRNVNEYTPGCIPKTTVRNNSWRVLIRQTGRLKKSATS